MQEMQLMSHTSSLFLCIQLSNCVFSCHMHSFSKKFNVFQKTNFVLPAWNGFWYVTVCSNGIVLDSSLAPLLRYVGLARLVQPLCNCYSCIKSQAWRFSCTSVFCLFTVLLFVCISVPSPFCVWWQIQISTCESSFMSPYTNLPIPIIELWRYVEVIKEIDYCDDILSVIRLRCQRSFALLKSIFAVQQVLQRSRTKKMPCTVCMIVSNKPRPLLQLIIVNSLPPEF